VTGFEVVPAGKKKTGKLSSSILAAGALQRRAYNIVK